MTTTYVVWHMPAGMGYTRFAPYRRGLSRLRAQAVARMLRKGRRAKAIVMPAGEHPQDGPGGERLPQRLYRKGERVRSLSHEVADKVGIIEGFAGYTDWGHPPKPLYRVLDSRGVSHLLWEEQIRPLRSHKRSREPRRTR